MIDIPEDESDSDDADYLTSLMMKLTISQTQLSFNFEFSLFNSNKIAKNWGCRK